MEKNEKTAKSLEDISRFDFSASLFKRAVFLYLSVGLLMLAALMYQIENETNPKFQSIGDGLWFGVTTITTVGYGNVVPITFPGRAVASFAFLFGVMAIGLPIHPIIANFSAVLRRNTEIKEAWAAATARQQAKKKENERKKTELVKKSGNVLRQNANSVCSCDGKDDGGSAGDKFAENGGMKLGFAPRSLRNSKGRRNTLAFL